MAEKKQEKEKKEKKESEEEKIEEESEKDIEFHDTFQEIKDSVPVLKRSNLEQEVSNTEIPKEEKREKNDTGKYSFAKYEDTDRIRDREMIENVDDLKRIQSFVPKAGVSSIRTSSQRPRVVMREQDSFDDIKYNKDTEQDIWEESLDNIRRKDSRKYRREA